MEIFKVFAFIVLLCAAAVNAATAVYPWADATLKSDSPNSNFGTLTMTPVNQDSQINGVYYDLVMNFNISNFANNCTEAVVVYQQGKNSLLNIFNSFFSLARSLGTIWSIHC
jgi:hypothetical protein